LGCWKIKKKTCPEFSIKREKKIERKSHTHPKQKKTKQNKTKNTEKPK
jgi:hypothetical protein